MGDPSDPTRSRDLRGAEFVDADLRDARFVDADLRDARFVDADLRGARFAEADLAGVVMRGVELQGADLDAPWLAEPDASLLINGVNVAGLVEAELDRRFPGRAERRAPDPAGLRAAWAQVERAWAGTLARVASMPEGTADVSVEGEWSFAQTLRHLLMATDLWLGRSVLELDRPFHPLGQAGAGAAEAGLDTSAFTTTQPTYSEVLAAREDRVALVRDFLASVTAAELDLPRRNPWNPDRPETTRSCLHVILGEEWEHLRFAVRDLDTLA